MPRLRDGFSTTIEFTEAPGLDIWEKTIKPPGMDGNGFIDTTGMRNTTWRTRFAKSLITLTDCTLTAAWDPETAWDTVLDDLLNVNGEITVNFPDGTDLVFFGYVGLFDPQEHREGEEALLSMTITPTNVDGNGAEVAPNILPAV